MFSVNAKEKVGIRMLSCLNVGLMRLVELDATIDGVDINKIRLHDLRSYIAITPQDTVLFLGTVRSNLDPFCHFLDDQNVCKASVAVEGHYLAARFREREGLKFHCE
ncbi:hypothetical protein F441_09408 [Phytophthora nicotianae CJ01A1]|uniref:ABC transporter domain-containing protein n=5 Tax=Phytophthora nicotianae TaxID=4792 RepID=W2Q8M1_PHYN3|nr:hypothetical protein PPTG_23050 [Phytophthora nicotianae INRA-310]ETI46134.1 hypothetical protein F443_09457 [Phytophthora nicotianae P1569]ETK86077.1 hypothetical protein L915_09269 [Phytophthora nicotianae]ETO74812.1 hypothetical protein F444_09533 [Phytophthora nicotianae P1976]ETP15944.1 hypothetical protein F441_09408 [Phytophthora nicotianae CJ01A1]ETL39504.1 hypothetical protein L916_09180 [Phytophthora nicotianae]